MSHILAIDQGTTSSRAIVFDASMTPIASTQEEFPQHFPQSGWVEHNPSDIWETVERTAKSVVSKAGLTADDIAGIGITNQRETTIVWDAQTGAPLYHAIVWQDRRTSAICDALKAQGHEKTVTDITGLLLDPYFSATKIKWILDHVEGARERARKGDVLFGTVDSYLIWRMTKGASHVTDATNASRTMLFDIHKGDWSDEMCALLDIPKEMLPDVRDCASHFGETDLIGGDTPILGVAGDQQAATIGQACFEPGMMKSTYGTGCFALINTGGQPIQSQNRLLTTIAYRLNGQTTYALEGSIFIAGAVVQWLRDGLGLIDTSSETQALAEKGEDGVIMVPAFTGLGAPYWKPECRGAVFGITRGTGPAEMARAALESIGFQTRDLWEAMKSDWPDAANTTLRVDGGLSANDWAMQFLADILNAKVDRPTGLETTALGAAWLAGMHVGLYPEMHEFAASWRCERQFTSGMDETDNAERYQKWQSAVKATIQV